MSVGLAHDQSGRWSTATAFPFNVHRLGQEERLNYSRCRRTHPHRNHLRWAWAEEKENRHLGSVRKLYGQWRWPSELQWKTSEQVQRAKSKLRTFVIVNGKPCPEGSSRQGTSHCNHLFWSILTFHGSVISGLPETSGVSCRIRMNRTACNILCGNQLIWLRAKCEDNQAGWFDVH